MHCENDQHIDYPAHFLGRAVWSEIEENKMREDHREERGYGRRGASSESSAETGISEYNALGSRQALFIMGWTRVLEASGGSGPPKARVLWAPIETGGVNRRAVSLRSLFAHEPRMVFRDNKRATSSSARTTLLRSFALSLFLSLLLHFSSSLTIVRLALAIAPATSFESTRFSLHSSDHQLLSFMTGASVIAKFYMKEWGNKRIAIYCIL